MKKMKYIIGIIILIVISYITIVYADYLYESKDVEYNNSNSTLNSTSVQGAIDELYEKVNELNANSGECPEGYAKVNEEIIGYTCQLPICKRASTLHTENCTNTNASCYCRGAGYANNGTITYGRLGTQGSTPIVGDAFDCDVNGDGVYDSATERFYYVSKYFDTSTKTFDNDYYVFIYYTDTVSGMPDTSSSRWNYVSGNVANNGPTTARDNLPSTSGTNAWRNDLVKESMRQLLTEESQTSNSYGALSEFSYSGKAARLITYQEIYSSCYDGSHSVTSTYGYGLKYKCEFLVEQAMYSNSSYKTNGPWLETVHSSSGRAWCISSIGTSMNYYLVNTYELAGARPTIEIHKNSVSY